MNLEQLKNEIIAKLDRVKTCVDRDVPLIIEAESKNEVAENFANESFDGKKWQNVKRRDPASPWYGHSGQTRKFSESRTTAKILDGETKLLGDSTSCRIEGKRVVITNDTPYAQIHNEGFSGSANFPSKKRKGSVVKAHTRQGKNGSVKVRGHKRKEADVKAYTRPMNIPKRQFIGLTKNLKKNIEEKVNREITKILNS